MKFILTLTLSLFLYIFSYGQTIKSQTSTYDDLNDASDIKSQKKALKKYDDNKVFYFTHNKLLSTMTQWNKEYFTNRPEYEIVYIAKGDIFLNNLTDYAFVVYDKKNERISIILFNELTKQYKELYREINVENKLESVDCNYHSFGTLDFQIGDNLAYQGAFLIKKPESLLNSLLIKIANISKDSDFILDKGCFANENYRKNPESSICISTSNAYNNWECLKYDKSKNVFIIYYGQAFAD